MFLARIDRTGAWWRARRWAEAHPTRAVTALFVCCASPAHADESAVARIADAIAMYRLSADFCHWPISAKAAQTLDSDEKHFRAKDPVQFAAGVKSGTERHALLARSSADYCHEVESSRAEMTQSLESRAK